MKSEKVMRCPLMPARIIAWYQNLAFYLELNRCLLMVFHLLYVASALSEEKDKEKRKLNVILHNVAEPTADNSQSRKREDIDHVSSIFHKPLGVSVQITNAVRLGKRGDKPRFLKVSVDSERSKASILHNCTRLRGKDVPVSLSKVFITPDMTPKEREYNKSLRDQLTELNKDGRSYKIKTAR